METYLINWLKNRQTLFPFNVAELDSVEFIRETIDHLYAILHSPRGTYRVTFIKNPARCEVVGVKFIWKGEQLLVQ